MIDLDAMFGSESSSDEDERAGLPSAVVRGKYICLHIESQSFRECAPDDSTACHTTQKY